MQPPDEEIGLSPEYVPGGHLEASGVFVQYIPGGQSYGVAVP